jgi:translation elongation factor EF-1beta
VKVSPSSSEVEIKPLHKQAKKIITNVHTRMKLRCLRISEVGFRIMAANEILCRCVYRKRETKREYFVLHCDIISFILEAGPV